MTIQSFRRDVPSRSANNFGIRGCLRRAIKGDSESEITNSNIKVTWLFRIKEDVFGFQISVDNAFSSHEIYSEQQLCHYNFGFFFCEDCALFQFIAQGSTFLELH